MDWLIQNWYYIVFIVAVVIGSVYGLMSGKAKEWLKFAVCVAEEKLGKETGQLKLRYVYDMFVEQFPAFAAIVPFSIFSKWVDLALEWMREQLNNNAKFKTIIEGSNG